jgi:predicted nucleic acid-binding protein
VLLSAYILDESRRVLPRLVHRHGLTAAEIGDLVDALSIQVELIEPQPGDEPDLRDVNDQPVLGTLLAALKTLGADYLITGDKDSLAIAERYPIVTPAKFWATHAGL